MTLDASIQALVAEAVADAAERASRSKEVMNSEEARHFLGLTKDEFKKRRQFLPCRRESERKVYYLREDLLDYLRSLTLCPESASDYLSDYGAHSGAPYNTGSHLESA